MPNDGATIFALASAPGRAGVAVVRVSGKDAGKALALCGPGKEIQPRKASLRHIADPCSREEIDRALVLWFPAPGSYTGEDVVEYHVHGGRSVLSGLFDALRRLPGFRPAEPGEFTRRAFENGKLDLTEAEAVADIVNAETAAQRRQALRQLDGGLGRLYGGWAERLKKILAYIEADIDFSDDEIPESLSAQQMEEIKPLLEEIDNHLDDKCRGERLREGFSVAIIGPPNAGKSSLLNALATREAAIVAPLPGTTRDVIEVYLDLGGYPVALADTAGLRESLDAVEKEGVHRALARAAGADLKILLFDGTEWPVLDEKTLELRDENSLMVINKTDLITRDNMCFSRGIEDFLFISALTGEGLKELGERLIQAIEKRFAFSEQPSLTRARHRTALEDCRDCLRRALSAQQVELTAEDVRLALRALGRITGKVEVEDLLDLIFKDFCIGK